MSALTKSVGTSTNSDVHHRKDRPPRPIVRDEVERIIRLELLSMGRKCDPIHATKLVDMLYRAADRIRKSGYTSAYILSDMEIETLHCSLNTIMPDEVKIPEPESAHEAVLRLICRERELSIFHTRVGEDACCLAIQVDRT